MGIKNLSAVVRTRMEMKLRNIADHEQDKRRQRRASRALAALKKAKSRKSLRFFKREVSRQGIPPADRIQFSQWIRDLEAAS